VPQLLLFSSCQAETVSWTELGSSAVTSGLLLYLWKLFEDCWDRKGSSKYWLNRTVKSLFRTPSEATTLKCNLLHFKPMLPFLHENNLPYIFSRLDGEDEGGEGCY
jgi:hypothetical protein